MLGLKLGSYGVVFLFLFESFRELDEIAALRRGYN
jgi:hypothetical protein